MVFKDLGTLLLSTPLWSKAAFLLSHLSSLLPGENWMLPLGKPSEYGKEQLTRNTSFILMKLSELEWSSWNLWSRVMFGSLSKWERHTTDVPRALSRSLSFIWGIGGKVFIRQQTGKHTTGNSKARRYFRQRSKLACLLQDTLSHMITSKWVMPVFQECNKLLRLEWKSSFYLCRKGTSLAEILGIYLTFLPYSGENVPGSWDDNWSKPLQAF